MKKDKIIKLEEKYTKIKEDNNIIKTKISYLRLLLFFILVATLIVFFIYYKYTVVFPIIVLGLFIYVSIIHQKYFKIVDNASFKLTVLKNYENRFDDTFKKNADSGLDLKTEAYFETDLDIFGKSSLFSYLSFAKTPYGRCFLAEALRGNEINEESLLKRKEAIKELTQDFEKTLDIEAEAFKFSGINNSKKLSTLENAFNLISNSISFDSKKLFANFLMVAVLIVSIVLAAIGKISVYSPLAILVINYFLSKLLYANIAPVSTAMSTINNIFYGYNYLLESISNKNFESELLKNYQEDVKRLNSSSIKSFNLISNMLASRNNIIFAFIFNGICMFDGIILFCYQKWQAKYENDFKNAIIGIGHFEELISLSTIGIVKDTAVDAKISNNFKFESIKHPLIQEDKCVANSFEFVGTNIITGSNMSGKTTFMRSIGVNYLLFLSGSMVNAEAFEAPICKLFTSMKVVDDVNNNISTFYGEILRVKEICSYIKENKPMIVLIDEIFKGTNTKDRLTGAEAVTKKLLNSNALAIITTHDSELCSIVGVNNYYFLEHYQNNQIAFDYTIRHGISNTRNAIYLLKMAGVIDEE